MKQVPLFPSPTMPAITCDAVPMESDIDGLHFRCWLRRDLAMAGKPGLVFVMPNPSTADADNDDPTVRRCMNFGRAWGCRELVVVNLFARRATNPDGLRRHGGAAVGERNDEVLRWMRRHPATSTAVAAWGNRGAHLNRDAAAMAVIGPAKALGVTKRGGLGIRCTCDVRPGPFHARTKEDRMTGDEAGKGIAPVKQSDFDDAMRQILLAAKPSGQRREDRMPTKAKLDARYRLERRK